MLPRAGQAAPVWSCRRQAAQPAPQHRGRRALFSAPATPRQSEGSCRIVVPQRLPSPPAQTGGPLTQTWGELRNEGALACPPLQRGTATSIEWPGYPHSLVPCPSNALVSKTAAGHFVRSVNVSKIDENRLRHDRLEPVEIKRAELLPFSDNHKRGGAFGAGVGVLAKRDVLNQALGLL